MSVEILIVVGVVVLAGLFIMKKKSGCCGGHKHDAGKDEGHSHEKDGKKGCCGGH